MTIGFDKHQYEEAISRLKYIAGFRSGESVRPFVEAMLNYLGDQDVLMSSRNEESAAPTKLPIAVPLFKGEISNCCPDLELETKIFEDHTMYISCYISVIRCKNCHQSYVTSTLWRKV